MAGVSVTFELDAGRAAAALARLSDGEIDSLVYEVGQLVENQTRERIAIGKQAPDGAPWAPWSAAHAATRRAGQSLLVGEGDPGLLESIQNFTHGRTAEVGTPLVYGAIHQFGGAGAGKPGLPARPFLGLSDANEREIEALVVDSLAEVLQ